MGIQAQQGRNLLYTPEEDRGDGGRVHAFVFTRYSILLLFTDKEKL